MEIYEQARFHIKKVCQHPVIQLRRQDLHKGYTAVLSTDTEHTSVCKLERAWRNEILCGKTCMGEPVPTEREWLQRIHMKYAVHDLQTLCAGHGFGFDTQTLEIVEHIGLDPFQSGLRSTDAVCVDAKGKILGLDKTVVALSKLVLEHICILGAKIVESVILRRN